MRKQQEVCCFHPRISVTASLVSASSYHPGGVNGVWFDGSVRFVSETINAGTALNPPAKTGISPYGVWGATGSFNGGESVAL